MLNVAVIGCGYWGPNLIRNFMTHEQTNLLWVCDLSEHQLEKALTAYPTIKKTTLLSDVISDQAVEAVAICTPVASHYQIAKECLRSGKHILVEKPFTAKTKQAEELIKLADEKNLKIMCDHTFCYTEAVRKIKNIIDSGQLGDLLYYDSVRINLGLFQPDVNVLWDLAVHDIAILDFLIGKSPSSISAHGIAHTGKSENIGYLTLTYDDSFIAHFHVNWLAPVKIRKTLIGGSKKMIEWNDLVPGEKLKVYDKGVEISSDKQEKQDDIRISYRSGDIFSPYIQSKEALKSVIEEFVQSITNDRPPLTDGNAGLRVINILEEADRSIQSHRQY